MFYAGLVISLLSLGFFFLTNSDISPGDLINLPSLISLLLFTVGMPLASIKSELLEYLFTKEEEHIAERRRARMQVLQYAIPAAWIGGALLTLILLMNELMLGHYFPMSPVVGIPLLYTVVLAEFILRPWRRRLANER